MKVSIASDLHMEFHGVHLENKDESDVLILAGDICEAETIKRYPFDSSKHGDFLSKVKDRSDIYREFFKNVSKEWKNVIYVAGNHEHYDGTLYKVDEVLKQNLALISDNIHYLDRRMVEIEGVIFVGGTMWTDVNKGDPLTSFHLTGNLNDYRYVKYMVMPSTSKHNPAMYRKLRPSDTKELHHKTVGYFKHVVQEHRDKRIVVVSHHAPSFMSIPPHFKDDHLMNGGYSSDLSEMMFDNENIVLWAHGHTHDDFDYTIGNTRVICNPRGYEKYEPARCNAYTLKTVEI